jgi:hypothetical protein
MSDDDVLIFLLTKREAQVNKAHRCQRPTPVDRGPGEEPGPCRRAMWGDGFVDGEWHGLCSACWHEWNAFHGRFQTMKANPAAAKIDNAGLARLFITRGLDAAPLPPVDGPVADGQPVTAPIDAIELWAMLPTFDPEHPGEGLAA